MERIGIRVLINFVSFINLEFSNGSHFTGFVLLASPGVPWANYFSSNTHTIIIHTVVKLAERQKEPNDSIKAAK